MEILASQRDLFVFPHHVAGFTGKFDLHVTPVTNRLIVLGNLIVLGRVGIEVVFAIPLADLGNVAVQHESRLDDGIERRLVHHRQGTGQGQHHGISEGILLVTIPLPHPRKNLGRSLNLHVDLQSDNSFVIHFLKVAGSE